MVPVNPRNLKKVSLDIGSFGGEVQLGVQKTNFEFLFIFCVTGFPRRRVAWGAARTMQIHP